MVGRRRMRAAHQDPQPEAHRLAGTQRTQRGALARAEGEGQGPAGSRWRHGGAACAPAASLLHAASPRHHLTPPHAPPPASTHPPQNIELFGRIRAELLRGGYIRTPVVFVHPSCGTAEEREKLQVGWGGPGGGARPRAACPVLLWAFARLWQGCQYTTAAPRLPACIA